MSSDVYANGMSVSCKAGEGKSICCFPDICMTPPQTPVTPPGVPIPYPNTGLSSDTSSGSTTVKIGGQEVMLKDKSFFSRSSGDEAGCAPKKGVMTSQNMGKVYFAKWSMDVQVEGENVVRHLDLTTHNHGSNPNTVTWPTVEKAKPAPVLSKPCQSSCRSGVGDQRYDRLRKASPNSGARKAVNKPHPRICAGCGDRKKRLAADHVFPLLEITDLPGFACLPYKKQKAIANYPGNFVGLCKSCNSSKGAKTWADWKQNQAKGVKITAKTRNQGTRSASAARREMKRRIRQHICG